MKSICHLTAVHPTFDIRIFYKECVSLSKNGYRVSLIAPAEKLEKVSGVQIIPISLPKGRVHRMLQVTGKMYALARKQKASLYHFHDPELMLCGVLLKLSGRKVVFDIHENVALSILSKDWIPFLLKPVIRFLYRFIERFFLIFFDALVLAEESYLNYYPKRKSIVVLNYPIIDDEIKISRDFKPPLKFIYTGGISEKRGLWEMIDLIKKLNEAGLDVSLTLVGKIWSSELEVQLEKKLQELALSERISWLGVVPFSEVEYHLKNAAIGLAMLHPIPNYKESLPTKIFEYMQYGLPFMVSDFPLYRKYIDESRAGIVIDPMKIDIPKLTELLQDTNHLKAMVQNGINAVATKYNWNNEEPKLLSLYDKILA